MREWPVSIVWCPYVRVFADLVRVSRMLDRNAGSVHLAGSVSIHDAPLGALLLSMVSGGTVDTVVLLNLQLNGIHPFSGAFS